MVSFSCEACGDVLTKKKLDPHRSRCREASFTCIDCMVHFQGVQYRSHTSCISEDQKYQGALYKEKNKKQKTSNGNSDSNNYGIRNDHDHEHSNHGNEADEIKPTESQHNKPPKNMSLQPYVEDAGEERSYESWIESSGHTEDERSPAEGLPEAPTPPAATAEEHVNVFDYLIATGQTPNASNMHIPDHQHDAAEAASLVRYEHDVGKYLIDNTNKPLVQYGSGPVPVENAFVTPGSKTDRRRNRDGEHKKDKKRKHLHLDVPGDHVMTDAPPVLHSGLTGGLKGLMRPTYPPSPDYSGGDMVENSPASPLKKTKHLKHPKSGYVSNGLMSMIAGGVKKTSKKKSKRHSDRHREHKDPKLIEFRPQSKDGKASRKDGAMIVFKPRADAFLSFVNKGPESERGCSVNKALKRFHRERQASGSSLAKSKEEKELWRNLRMRRNERGEIVLFTG